MTEAEAERKAEQMMDLLDKTYMAGRLTEAEYNRGVKKIEEWTKLNSADRALVQRVMASSSLTLADAIDELREMGGL